MEMWQTGASFERPRPRLASMKGFTVRLLLPLLLLIAALSGTARAADELPPRAVAQTLLGHAASDFSQHVKPPPAAFRRVHYGVLRGQDGREVPVLCGEFLPAGSKGRWTPFATVRTSPYEQWLGGQAQGLCGPENFTRQDAHDYAAELLARLPQPR